MAMVREDSSWAFYGHSVCEAKINPAPKSRARKLVTKVSPLAAKDTITAPSVNAPALMCFGSIITLVLLHQCTEAKDMPSISAILIPGLHEVFVESIAPLPNLFVQQFCFDSAKLLSPPLNAH